MERKIICLICLWLIPTAVFAVPGYLTHQGHIILSDNNPLSGVESMTFSLYTSETGGSALWTETLDVVFDGGNYSVLLGTSTSLEDSLFEENTLYLGVQVVSNNEFAPRIQLTSVPYALRASIAESLAGQLEFGQLVNIPDGVADGDDDTLAALLENCSDGEVVGLNGSEWQCMTGGGMDGTGTVGRLPLFSGSATLTDSQLFEDDGKIGVGTETPKTALDVNGALRVGTTTDECTSELVGALRYNIDDARLEYCSGTDWLPVYQPPEDSGVQIGSNSDECTESVAGTLRWNSNESYLEVCDGTGWMTLQQNEQVTNYGNGSDGDLEIESSFNLNADTSGGRSVPDGVAYKVSQDPSGTTITCDSPAEGMETGDMILLINLRGSASNHGDVGNWEVLTVASQSGAEIEVQEAPVKSYNSGNFGDQIVVIQRVPQYGDVLFDSSDIITSGAWDGMTDHGSGQRYTGIVAFIASGAVNLPDSGGVSADELGYTGGRSMVYSGENEVGETYAGRGSNSYQEYYGGGGAGYHNPGSFSGGGAGGGYGTAGENGYCDRANGCGLAGQPYGEENLEHLFLGSGGGGGSENCDNCYTNGHGGAGGGIVVIWANQLNVEGSITARGEQGHHEINSSSKDGGGSGAGGSVYLRVGSANLGSDLVRADGGVRSVGNLGGSNSAGGFGGSGRIAVFYESNLVGSTVPELFSEQITP